MEILVKIILFILSLSLLIVLHELGHFLPAKWFKTKVEKFYLFFDFAPFNSLWKVQKGETEYGIGWLPLGGYVKIAGMVDESMDTEALKEPPKPWEFRSKPAWQRLIIMIGGVTVNFLLGFFIFAMMLWHYGEEYIPVTECKDGMQFDSVLIQEGFRNGDLVLKIGDKPYERLDPLVFVREIALNNATSVTVRRSGRDTVLTLPAGIGAKLTSSDVQKKLLLMPRVPFEVEKVSPNGPADKAGLLKGDRIVRIDGESAAFYDDFAAKSNSIKNKTVTFGILRGVDTLQIPIAVNGDGKLGVQRSITKFFHTSRQHYSLAAAIPAGINKGVNFLNDQLKAFGQMFKGKISAKDNVGSVITIGSLFPSTFHEWEAFWNITASLSIILAFMNLLPIPALDGGYVLFLLWEVVTGRKVSDNVMEKAVTIGFFLLLGLMALALGNDLWKNIFARFF